MRDSKTAGRARILPIPITNEVLRASSQGNASVICRAIHCLETGGKHIEPKHFRLMTACAEICRTAAHFMLMNSEHAQHLCKECAEICDQCAADCEKLGDMKDCVEACRRCAEACRKMAS